MTVTQVREPSGVAPRGPSRVHLVLEPTPLHPAPALSRELGVPVLFKRDDLTGGGLGGNKLRVLEFLIADALDRGCDSLVTGAGPLSNWTMLAALTSLRFGLEPHVVAFGTGAPSQGNLRLLRRLGVDVRFTGSGERASVDAGIALRADELRTEGRRPYTVPRGGATPLGALGYVRGGQELARQLAGRPDTVAGPPTVWVPTGSGGTHAGLVGAAALLDFTFTVTGVTVSRPADECVARVGEFAAGALALLGLAGRPLPRIDVRDGWRGVAYGVASPAGRDAFDLVARTEGVFLDPVYGAKAMSCLVDACRTGAATGIQVFLVTGGGPSLFADAADGVYAVPGLAEEPEPPFLPLDGADPQ